MLKDNIKQLRKQQRISQQQLADQLHVVRQTISKWERGTSVPDAQLLSALAAALQTTPNELLGPYAPAPEAAAAPPENLALENSLATQSIAYLSKFRHNAKTGITALSILAGALAVALVCLGLFAALQARDLSWLGDGAESGYNLNGTYEMRNLVNDDTLLQGARLSLANAPVDGHDGLWQLSGFWNCDPVALHGRGDGAWEFEEGTPETPQPVNGYFERTIDPNFVTLLDEEGKAVGWASIAWILGNNNEKGLVYARYLDYEFKLPRLTADVSHYDKDPYGGLWVRNDKYAHEITAEEWFQDAPLLGQEE